MIELVVAGDSFVYKVKAVTPIKGVITVEQLEDVAKAANEKAKADGVF